MLFLNLQGITGKIPGQGNQEDMPYMAEQYILTPSATNPLNSHIEGQYKREDARHLVYKSIILRIILCIPLRLQTSN